MEKKLLFLDSIITFLCLLSAYWLYSNIFINADVAWHVEGARRLLLGGSYLANIFDNNSPFVFAYYFPVIWLHRVTSLYYPNLIVVYILSTTLVSLVLCHFIINAAFEKNEYVAKKFIYYLILFILVFLPVFNLGHREIVLIYFFLPFFLINVFTTTYQKSFQINRWLFYATAVLASFGIVQNILYLSIPVFLDIYKYLKTKKFSGYQILFYACVFINVVLVTILYPEYIRHIIPMVLCYESGFNFPLLLLVLEILAFISLLTMIVVLINLKRLYKSDDIIMSFIAAVCSLLIYFFELKLWYYHLYPALTFVIILLGLLIIKYYEEEVLKLDIRPRVNLFTASLAVGMLFTVFMVIIGFFRDEFAIFHNGSDATKRWIKYTTENFANKKLFFFVISLRPAHYLPLYSNANIEVVSPWSNPWLLPYIILQKNNNYTCNLKNDIEIFKNLTTLSLAKNMPDFLIIENTPTALLYRGKRFNYVDFFSQDKRFAELFKHYKLYGYFDEYKIYKLVVLKQSTIKEK